MSILTRALDFICTPRETALQVRTATYRDLRALKRPCINYLDFKICSVLPYHAPLVRACIMEAKFHNNKKAQRLLGTALHEFIRAHFFARLDTIVFVPIPLSAKRRRERGYNQAEAVLKYALQSLPARIDTRILRRMRDTLPQSTLPKADRYRNLENAFHMRHPPRPNTLYIVVDDVFTTGGTLSAAYTAFVQAGATRVLAITLAY